MNGTVKHVNLPRRLQHDDLTIGRICLDSYIDHETYIILFAFIGAHHMPLLIVYTLPFRPCKACAH